MPDQITVKETNARPIITPATKASASPVIDDLAELFVLSEAEVVEGGGALKFVVEVLEEVVVCVEDELEMVVVP